MNDGAPITWHFVLGVLAVIVVAAVLAWFYE